MLDNTEIRNPGFPASKLPSGERRDVSATIVLLPTITALTPPGTPICIQLPRTLGYWP
jgi:hypothetical protein